MMTMGTKTQSRMFESNTKSVIVNKSQTITTSKSIASQSKMVGKRIMIPSQGFFTTEFIEYLKRHCQFFVLSVL